MKKKKDEDFQFVWPNFEGLPWGKSFENMNVEKKGWEFVVVVQSKFLENGFHFSNGFSLAGWFSPVCKSL